MQRTLGHCDSWRNPDDLRFTKGNINLNFPIGQLQCQNIYDVLYALESGKLNPRDIPSLRVISHEGKLWTLDNKLLYICRISPKVKRVSVVQVSGQRFLEKLLDENSPAAVESMSSAEFFPNVDKCDKSPRGELTFRADRVQLITVKKILEKETIRGKWSSAAKSSSSGRSVSSSTTVTSRISSQITESGSTCAQNSGSKTPSKTSGSLREASSTDSSGPSTEDSTMETKAECYPAVRSMTGHHHSEDSLRIFAEKEEEHESACTRRASSFPSSFSERRPSTSQASPRFARSLQRFPSAPRASRLVKRNSSDAFTRLEPRSSKTLQSDYYPADRPSSAAFPDDSGEHVCLNSFASCRDHCRENVSPSVSAKFPGQNFPENVPHSVFSRFQDNISGKLNVSQSFSAKSHNNSRGNSPEGVSQGLSAKLEIGRNELGDDDFELEAFVLPEFCSPPAHLRDSKCNDGEEISPFHTSQRLNTCTSISSSRDRLDRSVSSCSSSTERPMNNKAQHSELPNKGDPRRKGIESSSSLLRNFSLLHKSNIGRSLSPLRRASVSAGTSMKCHLSAEHEFEVTKQILLKHMKKAFFSVC